MKAIKVREFYAALEGSVVVGIEATGATQWFLELLEELGIVCRVGHPAKIRAAETRKQKHDRRDARLMLDLLMREDGFPEIWMSSSEQRDLRTLLRDRHQWVRIRTRVQNTLQGMALNHALRRGRGLWTEKGQKALRALSLPSYTSQRRDEPCLVLGRELPKLLCPTGIVHYKDCNDATLSDNTCLSRNWLRDSSGGATQRKIVVNMRRLLL